jgi:hypothetical protein
MDGEKKFGARGEMGDEMSDFHLVSGIKRVEELRRDEGRFLNKIGAFNQVS